MSTILLLLIINLAVGVANLILGSRSFDLVKYICAYFEAKK